MAHIKKVPVRLSNGFHHHEAIDGFQQEEFVQMVEKLNREKVVAEAGTRTNYAIWWRGVYVASASSAFYSCRSMLLYFRCSPIQQSGGHLHILLQVWLIGYKVAVSGKYNGKQSDRSLSERLPCVRGCETPFTGAGETKKMEASLDKTPFLLKAWGLLHQLYSCKA